MYTKHMHILFQDENATTIPSTSDYSEKCQLTFKYLYYTHSAAVLRITSNSSKLFPRFAVLQFVFFEHMSSEPEESWWRSCRPINEFRSKVLVAPPPQPQTCASPRHRVDCRFRETAFECITSIAQEGSKAFMAAEYAQGCRVGQAHPPRAAPPNTLWPASSLTRQAQTATFIGKGKSWHGKGQMQGV